MYRIFTDTSANLPAAELAGHAISVVRLGFQVEGVDDAEFFRADGEFKGRVFYSWLRAGANVTTTMVNLQTFTDAFEPALRQGGRAVRPCRAASAAHTASTLGRRSCGQIQGADDPDGRHPRGLAGRGTAGALCRAGEGRGKEHRGGGQNNEDVQRAHLPVFHGRRPEVSAEGRPHLPAECEDRQPAEHQARSDGQRAGRDRHERQDARDAPRARGARGEIRRAGRRQSGARASRTPTPHEAEELAQLLRGKGLTGEILSVCYEPVTGAHVGPGAVALFFSGIHR